MLSEASAKEGSFLGKHLRGRAHDIVTGKPAVRTGKLTRVEWGKIYAMLVDHACPPGAEE